MSLSHNVRIVRLAASVVGVLVAVLLEPASAAPARLRVTVDGKSVKVGSRAKVVLTFFDRDFRPVENDKARSVLLEVRSTGAASEGKGEIAPTLVNVPAGITSYSAIRFTARAAGTVLVRATSVGLAPGEAPVRVSSGSSLASGFFFPVVHAQESPSFEILPPEHVIPLNGLSTAQFSISVDQAAPAGQSLNYRVVTDPPVPILYGSRKSVGVAIIKVEGEQYLSDQFEILPPSRPGRVSVRAQALPGGLMQANVEFLAPQPVHVGIEPMKYTINSHERVVPLHLQLLDGDRIPLRALVGPHVIELQSDPDSGRFEPQTVTLSSTKLRGSSELRVPGVRFGGALKVLAKLKDIEIAEAEFEVTAAVLALLSLAALGGFLGGLARHVYRVGTPHVWPRRLKGRVEPGLLVNALFSALSGLVLCQAIDVGLLHQVVQLEKVHGSVTLAFVLGVAGGFAGVVVFEVLTDRVLPRKGGVQTSSI